MINFEFDNSAKILSCSFEGRMDSPASMQVEKEIEQKLGDLLAENKSGLCVRFDLAKVEYIASAFIRICLQTAKQVEKEKFSVCNTNPFVMKIFKMAGLDHELNVS